MNGWERHARASWKLAGQVWSGIDTYHSHRKNRPTAQKVKLGCLAFAFLWIPFVIPFVVYSYIAMAAGVVAIYATLVSILWGVSVVMAKARPTPASPQVRTPPPSATPDLVVDGSIAWRHRDEEVGWEFLGDDGIWHQGDGPEVSPE